MGISLSDLSPKARAQVLAKFAAEDSQRKKTIESEMKPSKYKAKKVQGCLADGTPHTFDSVKEFDRYQSLCLLERAGEISNLRVQVPFELIPKQKRSDGKTEKPCSYIADFVYERNGKTVVEDTKGIRTKDYIIKRKLVLWIHHITITEV